MKTYAVIGLGYVGLGLAASLGEKSPVIGYDINTNRIDELRKGVDSNQLLSKASLARADIRYTSDLDVLKLANFYFITVSTPTYYYEIPDLEPLIGATKQLGSVLKKGDMVVFESTVYPGTTEDICIPILETISHLQHGKDFQVGYSPERINPGDKQHTLKNVTKIVSAQNKSTCKTIQKTYETICDHVYPVSSIPTAEAIKILENIQRDVNIALMNEFTKVMHALNLNMHEILEGAKTKFGFVPYKPGLVGGHCISVDPHYLIYEAKRQGIHPDLISTARKVNDDMTQFIIQSMMKLLIRNKINTEPLTIGIFGISYKENTVDIRNSLSLKLIRELQDFGFHCRVHDPLVPPSKWPLKELTLESFDDLSELSVAMILVGHDFYRTMGLNQFLQKCGKTKILMDIPNVFVNAKKPSRDLIYWNL